ncbi:hypothetical protein A1OW_02225 [Enterovibrio norvegicus]|uniref:hypothetical protein n=1 Tax=Enterovibrio norvegicus TaxID=188144 RepID=UPI000304675C|nr:hypothetical protein [Enterovibrio norvegicus]OEF48550.1 hypothetical protein A1OW_02225 [Enterovibrio norvegicus]
MGSNRSILNSIKKYLTSIDSVEKSSANNYYSIWCIHDKSLEIMLPVESVVEHPQSKEILDEAILKIANSNNEEFYRFKYKLQNAKYDMLEVRNSGKKIEHGKINFDEGIDALNGLHSIIKNNANRNIKAKGKRETVKEYMNGINMLAPKAGSFIYSVEFELTKKKEEDTDINYSMDSGSSIGRYLNQSLARNLFEISKSLEKKGDTPTAKLMSLGVDSGFCQGFLNLFSEKSEKLEFNFDWSYEENTITDIPNKISFCENSREKIRKLNNNLSKSKAKTFLDLPACIEKYSWPIDEDMGKIHIRIFIDKKDYSCFIEVDSELYEKLKKEQAKKEILISLDLLFTSKRRMSVEVLKVYSIKTSDDVTIKIDI